ncbi:MAG TPA: PAAR-like protein [Pyrinomonadaceae bacterium]
MPELAVVNGAVLQCDKGSSPSPLAVTTVFTPVLNFQPTATINDHKTLVNIKPFGVCAITGYPCIPVTPVPWPPRGASILLPSFTPILAQGSQLPCVLGGLIHVLVPGQTTVLLYSPTEMAILNEINELEDEKRRIAAELLADLGATADPTGFADLGLGIRHLFKGHYGEAMLSGLSALPAGDLAGKPAKVLKARQKIAKLLRKMQDLRRKLKGLAGRTPSGFPKPPRGPFRRARSKRAAREAYEEAKNGGRHGGHYRNYVNRSDDEIRDSIRSYEERIAEHHAAIKDPRTQYPDFDNFDPRRQRHLVTKKWPGDIARLHEQKAIMQGILKERRK